MTITAATADQLPPSTTEQAHKKVHKSKMCPIIYDTVAKEADDLLNPGYFKGLYLNYFPAGKFDTLLTMQPKYIELHGSFKIPQVYFKGYVTTQGILTAAVEASMIKNLSVISVTELRNSRLNMALVLDYKARNYRAQVQLLGMDIIRATYIQAMLQDTARYETDKMVASTQVESSGDVLMTYVHKISKKVSLATDFVYNCCSRDVKASVGYGCVSTQSRVRGKIDSDGVVYGILQRELNVGLKVLLSASLDHKLGLRLTTFGYEI